MSSVHVGIPTAPSPSIPTPPTVEEILETDTVELILLFLACISFLSCFYRSICTKSQGTTSKDERYKSE